MADKWKKKDVELPNIELNVYRGETEAPIEPMDINPDSPGALGLDLRDPKTAAMIVALRKRQPATME
jgi:hypothetical protein